MIYLNDEISSFDWKAAMPLLSEQRRQQVLKFRHEQGRRTCAAAYLLLCEGLRKEYGVYVPPVFDYGEHGKPFIASRPDIHFSISHCSCAAICVLSDRPVGVDVESIREYRESLVRYAMNDKEVDSIVHSANPALDFIRLWTMKEAVVKMTGIGIQGDSIKEILTGNHRLRTVVNEEKGYVYSVTEE